MTKLIHTCLFIILIAVLLFFSSSIFTYAQTTDQEQGNSNVSGRVGAYYLDVSGIVAPNASVVLIANDIILRSTVANANGYFSLAGVVIQEGLTNFCLQAIDFKRLGESYTCFEIDPAEGNVTRANIFLPPTLGLQRSEITIGDDAIVWGYSMPFARVTVHASDGKTFLVTADERGYYEYAFNIKTAGKYELFADALYQEQESETPDRTTTLTVLTQAQSVVTEAKKKAEDIGKSLIGSPWGILFLLIPLLAVIILFLKKLKPEWFTFIEFSGFSFWHKAKLNTSSEKKLHHAWFVGY